MIAEHFENILEDGKVQKHIMVKSSESNENYPKDKQMAKICYKCRKSDYSIVDENNDKENAFEFEVGSEGVIKGLNVGIRTMKLGETSVLKIHPDYAYGASGSGAISANETIYFEAELVEFKDKQKTKEDYTSEERMALAKNLKVEGGKLYGEGKLEEAKKLYEEALDLIDWEKDPEAIPLKIALRNNVGLICLNIHHLQESVINCNHVLEFDKKNIKALYKKAKANRLMQNFEEAEEILKGALEIDGGDKALLNEQLLLKKDLHEYRQKERNMFAKSFN